MRPAHHWHRDFNATQNMRAIYYSLLETKQRPGRRPEAGSGRALSGIIRHTLDARPVGVRAVFPCV